MSRSNGLLCWRKTAGVASQLVWARSMALIRLFGLNRTLCKAFVSIGLLAFG